MQALVLVDEIDTQQETERVVGKNIRVDRGDVTADLAVVTVPVTVGRDVEAPLAISSARWVTMSTEPAMPPSWTSALPDLWTASRDTNADGMI